MMETVLILLVILAGISEGKETFCYFNQNVTECYGPLGGNVYIQLSCDANYNEMKFRKTLKENNIEMLKIKNNTPVIHESIRNRAQFFLNNVTFLIQDTEMNDSAVYILETFIDGKSQCIRYLHLFIEAPVSSPQLTSECLDGTVRVSCSSQGDNVQFTWTLDGHTVPDTEGTVGNETNIITLRKGLSGSLRCDVRNNVSNEANSTEIKPCPDVTPSTMPHTTVTEDLHWTTYQDMLSSFCDVTVDGSLCYGALGGSVYLSLINDALGYNELRLRKDPSGEYVDILKMKDKYTVIDETIRSRSAFFINNGTFMILNIEMSDAAEYEFETFQSGKNIINRRFQLSIKASRSSPQLSSECLAHGEIRVSCSSERGSPQYSWTLNGSTLDRTMAFLSDIRDTVILKKGIVGSQACTVNNDINTPTVTWDISPCTAHWINVYVYVKFAEIFILLTVCLGLYWFYKKTCTTVQDGSRGSELSPVDHV